MMKRLLKATKILCLAVCLMIVSCAYFPLQQVMAAEETVKPAKPVISAKVQNDGTSVKITISKTSDGKGNITLVKPDGTFTTHKAYQQDGEGFVPVIKVDLKKCNVYTE